MSFLRRRPEVKITILYSLRDVLITLPRLQLVTASRTQLCLVAEHKLEYRDANSEQAPMRKFLLAAASVGLMTVTNAYAAETTGTVRSINTKSRASITLSDGKVYMLPEGIEAELIKVGERVRITFSQRNGKNRASSVEQAK